MRRSRETPYSPHHTKRHHFQNHLPATCNSPICTILPSYLRRKKLHTSLCKQWRFLLVFFLPHRDTALVYLQGFDVRTVERLRIWRRGHQHQKRSVGSDHDPYREKDCCATRDVTVAVDVVVSGLRLVTVVTLVTLVRCH